MPAIGQAIQGAHMDSEIRIDHPDLAYLDLTIATHDPQTDRPVSSTIAREKIWEGFLTRQLLTLISNPAFRSFYDLGANLGWHSLVLACHLRKHGLDGHVVAVEPAQSNHARLSRSLTLNALHDRVNLVPAALSDRSGTARLDHDPVNAGNHHLSGFSWPSDSYVTSEEVPIHRLDDLVQRNGWPLPTLIKMDVQGHEMQALAGFGSLLDAVPDWILAIEFVPDFWRLEDLLALVRADAVYHVDEQSLQIVPTSPERLRAIAADWLRGYFDLILVKGPKARQAVTALPAYCDRAHIRFVSNDGAGFAGLSERMTRWVGQQADCVIDPLTPGGGSHAIELSGQVLRRMWTGVISLSVHSEGQPRQRLLLKQKTPFTLRCELGAQPLRLHFALRETPQGQRRHPTHAFQLSHLALQVV